MENHTYSPKKTLNLAIKKSRVNLLNTRDDVWGDETGDEDNLFFSTKIRDMNGTDLVGYNYDKDQDVYTVESFGIVVAEMGWHISMQETRQHKDIFEVIHLIDKKSEDTQRLKNAMVAMSEQEQIVFKKLNDEIQKGRQG